MLLALLRAVTPATQAADPDNAALFAAVSAVLVALIGAAVAVITTGRRLNQPPPPRVVDEPSTHALPRELADMLVEVIAERDVWKNRAVRLGWEDEGAT